MGLFNILFHTSRCKKCNFIGRFSTQYKHGYLRQLNYVLGEKIDLDGDADNVRVNGSTVEKCSRCGEDVNFDLILKDSVIVSVVPTEDNLFLSGPS